MKKVRGSQPLLDDVAAIENMRVSFTLIKFCLGVCKVIYLLRVTLVDSISTVARLFDVFLESTFRRLVGGTLYSKIYKELQLPLKTSSEFPHLGIGLTSAEETATSVFLSSAVGCNNLVEQAVVDTSLKGLYLDVSAKEAYDVWARQCERSSVLPFDAFKVEQPPQHKS